MFVNDYSAVKEEQAGYEPESEENSKFSKQTDLFLYVYCIVMD